MIHSRLKRVGAAAACVAVGTLAGIASSAAAPGRSSSKATRAGTTVAGVPAPPGAVFSKLGGPAVHSVEIVSNRAGDGFDTVTQDSGTVKSVAGDSLTITEGTDKATYGTPTLTIPAGATVERNFKTAKLADLHPGDHVEVTATAGGTTNVFAVEEDQWPPEPPQFMTKGGPLPRPPFAGPVGVAYGSGTVTSGTP